MTEDLKSTSTDVPAATEKVRVQGEVMAAKVKDLLHEGNVRRITVKDSVGNTVMEVPVTAAVVAAVIAPVVTAVAALASLAAHWEIEVDRTGERSTVG